MDTRSRWTSAVIIVAALLAALLAVPLGAASAQSPGAGESGDLIGGFTAHLRGSQTEHVSSLWNVSYDPPGKGCKPGLMSHSTDQQMTFESQPVEVVAVRVPPDTDGWGGQAYVLVPADPDPAWVTQLATEMLMFSAPGTDMYSAPVLFELPVNVTVNKAYARPATGQAPAQPVPLTVACTGGDGTGQAPDPPDCGERTFASFVAVTLPQVGVALPASGPSADSGEAPERYANCPGSVDDSPGRFVWGDTPAPTYTGGPLPTVEQLLDPNLTAVDIIGQVTGGYEEPGYMSSQALDWTLTLCREGATAPNC